MAWESLTEICRVELLYLCLNVYSHTLSYRLLMSTNIIHSIQYLILASSADCSWESSTEYVFFWVKKEHTARTLKFCSGEAKPKELLRDQSWANLKGYFYTAVPGEWSPGNEVQYQAVWQYKCTESSQQNKNVEFSGSACCFLHVTWVKVIPTFPPRSAHLPAPISHE